MKANNKSGNHVILDRKKRDPDKFIYTGKVYITPTDIQLFKYNVNECLETVNLVPSQTGNFEDTAKYLKLAFRYDPENFMHPWTMVSEDQRLNLTFTPFFNRHAKTDVKILISEVHQMFGKYSGTLVTEEGQTLEIKDLIGFAEEHHARW